ncbi:hypothetical protein EIP91_005577 [Steccherinum ochraceum]|uniref:Uncharacterized protein n=1 Tax=Steccherinum ochraceum TaxID=92696 RepID=A0A4R0RZK2_9APHY|nr:hypothetical protein EIP91_005577 [Steccherinum ochraceum]
MTSSSSPAESSGSQEYLPAHDISAEDAQSLNDEDIKKLLQEAGDLKEEGNEHFRDQSWDEALAVYRSALGRLPKRKVPVTPQRKSDKGKGKARDTDASSDEEEEGEDNPEEPSSETTVDTPEPTELERECAKTRAVLSSNIGACFVKLGDHKEAVAACTEALHDDPTYVRALQRRAASNEQIGSWSALASAQEGTSTPMLGGYYTSTHPSYRLHQVA